MNSSLKHWYIKLISRINNAIKHWGCIKILNVCKPVAMEMAKFQYDYLVVTTTLEPKCFQVVYKAAKREVKMPIAILETSYKFKIPDILSRCFKKKTSISSFCTNTYGFWLFFYRAPAFVVSSIVHIALNLRCSISITPRFFAIFSVLHTHFSSLRMRRTTNKLLTLQYE